MPAITPLSENYHVSAQVHPDDVAAIANTGYTTLVCMRPDGEADGQPGWADVAAAARSHGLAFHFIPVRPGAVSPVQAAHLREVMRGTDGRILSYCASGNRCTLAWQMALSLPG